RQLPIPPRLPQSGWCAIAPAGGPGQPILRRKAAGPRNRFEPGTATAMINHVGTTHRSTVMRAEKRIIESRQEDVSGVSSCGTGCASSFRPAPMHKQTVGEVPGQGKE